MPWKEEDIPILVTHTVGGDIVERPAWDQQRTQSAATVLARTLVDDGWRVHAPAVIGDDNTKSSDKSLPAPSHVNKDGDTEGTAGGRRQLRKSASSAAGPPLSYECKSYPGSAEKRQLNKFWP